MRICSAFRSDHCCSQQGMGLQTCTVGRLVFREEAQSAFDKFASTGFYIFLVLLGGNESMPGANCPATNLSLFKRASVFQVCLCTCVSS